jgi:hypothetical protein
MLAAPLLLGISALRPFSPDPDCMPQLAALFPRDRFAMALLFVGLMAAACLIPAQSDTWWQLRAGEEMWRGGRVMLHDEFTHTVAGGRWPNHEWLTQALFYRIYALGGLPLLTLFCASAVTLAWWIVSRLTPGPPLVRVGLVGLGAMLSSPAWCLRPQVLTLTMCALTLLMLVRRRCLWALPALFALWANLHGAVALGGVLVMAAWIACALHDRARLPALTIVGALCLAATAATPLGFALWLEVPHSLQRLQDYGVLEWRAPDFTTMTDLPFWAIAAAIAVLAVVHRRRIATYETLTLVLGSFFLFLLGTRSMRNVAPFLICAIPTIAALAGTASMAPAFAREESPRKLAQNAALFAAVAAGIVLFIASAWARPLPRLQWEPVSSQAISAIDACPGRLYNRYDEGGYLIWFVRHRKVFLDSRQDPFPPDLVLGHIALERTGEYRPLFDRYDIGCALSIGGSPLAQALERDGWTSRDAGGGWKVFERPRQAAVETGMSTARRSPD